MSNPIPTYTFSFRQTPDSPELEIHYSIEPADPDVGIRGGDIDSWTAFDAYGRELKPEDFSKHGVVLILGAIQADIRDRIEATQADIAAHAFETKD